MAAGSQDLESCHSRLAGSLVWDLLVQLVRHSLTVQERMCGIVGKRVRQIDVYALVVRANILLLCLIGIAIDYVMSLNLHR